MAATGGDSGEGSQLGCVQHADGRGLDGRHGVLHHRRRLSALLLGCFALESVCHAQH